jgi:tricorn protease
LGVRRAAISSAFCRLPLESHRWKRYRGGQANHVWIADLEHNTFRPINHEAINEQYPVWIGARVYYVSEKEGTANLWCWEPQSGHAAQITYHDAYDVKAPSGDGRKIVYECGNALWLYDAATGEDRQVRLTLASDRLHARPHTVAGTVGAFRLGPTGERLVVEGRGQVFTLPVEKGEPRAIAPLPGSRAKDPAWSPDGKWIASISDRTGEENLWLAPASGEGEARRLTSEARLHLHNPIWSPDSRSLAYIDESLALWLVDVESGNRTEVARGEYGPIQDARFSPDGKWLAYSRPENHFVRSLYLYPLAERKVTRLTFPPTRDHSPVFDPAGRYLYFLSERSVTPSADGFDFQNDFDRTTRLYALTLARDTPSPVPVESDEEPAGADGGRQTADGGQDARARSAPTPNTERPTPPLRVDLEGIEERLAEIPVPAGRYSRLEAIAGKLLYLSREEVTGPPPGPGAPPPGLKLKAYNLTGRKETELASGVQEFALSADGKKVAVRSAAGIQVADAGTPFTGSGAAGAAGTPGGRPGGAGATESGPKTGFSGSTNPPSSGRGSAARREGSPATAPLQRPSSEPVPRRSPEMPGREQHPGG